MPTKEATNPKLTNIIAIITNRSLDGSIKMHVGKNVVDDVLLDGDFGMNAIVNGLKWKLGLPPHQHGPFNLKMDNFSYNKPLGIIPNIQI